jgi:hypothetical protein
VRIPHDDKNGNERNEEHTEALGEGARMMAKM